MRYTCTPSRGEPARVCNAQCWRGRKLLYTWMQPFEWSGKEIAHVPIMRDYLITFLKKRKRDKPNKKRVGEYVFCNIMEARNWKLPPLEEGQAVEATDCDVEVRNNMAWWKWETMNEIHLCELKTDACKMLHISIPLNTLEQQPVGQGGWRWWGASWSEEAHLRWFLPWSGQSGCCAMKHSD